MKIKLVPLAIGLTVAVVACAQTTVNLKYDGFEPGFSKYYPGDYCRQLDSWKPVSDASGFTVEFGWTCQHGGTAPVTGKLRVDYSPLTFSAAGAGAKNQIFTFSPAVKVTAKATFNASSPPTSAERPTITIVAGVPWSGRLFTTFPRCGDATVSATEATLTCRRLAAHLTR